RPSTSPMKAASRSPKCPTPKATCSRYRSPTPTDVSTSPDHDLVLVVDFGAQYAQLIARRVREAHVYSEIVSRSMPIAEMLARKPKAIILSGGPASVHVDGAPSIDPAIYDAGVPILGICYGAQLVARDLGGEVAKTGVGEYGRTVLGVDRASVLLADHPEQRVVWMSHF